MLAKLKRWRDQKTQSTTSVAATLSELLKTQEYANRVFFSQKQAVHTRLFGNHAALLRGRGMDFAEARLYQPGDDPRHIHWSATARTGRVHTKIYQEERERPVYLIIDQSPSMFFGTRCQFKSALAAKMAATVGFAALGQRDRVGAIIFSGEHTTEFPVSGERKSFLHVLQSLSECSAPSVAHSAGFGLANVLERCRRVARTGSLIFIFSDFYLLNAEATEALRLLALRHPIRLHHVFDPLEAEPPLPNLYGLTDGEKELQIDSRDREFVRRYRALFVERTEYLRTTFLKLGLSWRSFSTDGAWQKQIL